MIPRQIVWSLGANLGDRLAALRTAVAALRNTPGVEVTAVSSVYETAPVGGVRQDDFLNVVAIGRSSLAAKALLNRGLAIEYEMGRVRSLKWGPRVIDVDLIAVGTIRWNAADLTLPHPRASERAFVVVPWLEVDPDAELPGVGPVVNLVLDSSGIRRLADRL